MTRSLKTGLLASVGAFALVSTAISPASAFDVVNWSWDAEVTETVTKNVTVTIDLVPTGMVMVEDLQVSIGDIDAYSEVSGVYNDQPILEDAEVAGTRELQFQYAIGGALLDNGFQSDAVVDAFVDETDEAPDINGTVTLTVDLAELDFELVGVQFDAVTELPEVVSTATAVANNASISSEVSVELHEGQFAFNVGGEGDIKDVPDIALGVIPDQNTNLGGAALLTWYALNGSTVPAQVQAISDVDEIFNASVDSSATAVANNLTVDVDADFQSDALVLADIVQYSHANVYADSLVSNVELNNYTNLGLAETAIGRPIVSSVATAVGNNKTITVTSPFSQ